MDNRVIFTIILLGVTTYIIFGTNLIIKNTECNGGCSGNGICNKDTNKCECNKDYSGDNCKDKNTDCNGGCSGNGICNKDTNKCECNKDYSGTNCEKRCINNCYGNGTCTGIDECDCDHDYYGLNCRIPCSTSNGRGNWVKDDTISGGGVCNCTNDNFTGPGCSTLTCLNGGKEKGNKCECSVGFSGDTCQNGDTCEDDNDCSGVSKCTHTLADFSDGYIKSSPKRCEPPLNYGDVCASGDGSTKGYCQKSTCKYSGKNIWKCGGYG
jgi:hypothetical protein